MSRLLLLGGLCLSVANAAGQNMAGFNTGNYTGVTSVFFNPASIADSRYRFDINLFSLDASAGSNKVAYSLGNTFKGDTLKNQLFGTTPGTASILANVAIQGPSVMINTKTKWAFALTTRARVIANVRHLDSKLVNSLSNELSDDASLPYTIQSTDNMALNVNAWREIGLSAVREVWSAGPHFLKAGLTLRYLMSVGNAYMVVKNFNGTINQDAILQQPYLSSTTGGLGMGFAGVNLSDFKASQLEEVHGAGVGADLGAVYEFRPEGSYLFRLGLSLLDLGKIGYTPDPQSSGGYNIGFRFFEQLQTTTSPVPPILYANR